MLLVVSMGGTTLVKADTYVDFYSDGSNVKVEIYTDGTVSLFYNGVNIQAEINELKSMLNSIGYHMSQLATKTEVNNLNQTVFQLIGELDTILEDLFGKTHFLANVIGLNSEDSVIAANLMSGSYTIVDYLNSITEALDDVAEDINILDEEVSSVYGELQAFESYVEAQLNTTNLEIESLAGYTEEQRTLIRSQILTLEANIQVIFDDITAQRQEFGEAVLNDLNRLENIILDEASRQDITEMYIQDLQTRLYDMENAFGGLILILIAMAIIVCLKKLKNRRKSKKHVSATD